jgi:hypothetical protein
VSAAQQTLRQEQQRDRRTRGTYAAYDDNVGQAYRARREAEIRERRAETRTVRAAARQGNASGALPSWIARRHRALRWYNEQARRGFGNAVGEWTQERGAQIKQQGLRRTGGFIEAVGRTASLRGEERTRRAAAARSYDNTINQAKQDETLAQIKKLLDQQNQQGGQQGGGAPPAQGNP